MEHYAGRHILPPATFAAHPATKDLHYLAGTKKNKSPVLCVCFPADVFVTFQLNPLTRQCHSPSPTQPATSSSVKSVVRVRSDAPKFPLQPNNSDYTLPHNVVVQKMLQGTFKLVLKFCRETNMQLFKWSSEAEEVFQL